MSQVPEWWADFLRNEWAHVSSKVARLETQMGLVLKVAAAILAALSALLATILVRLVG